MEEFKIVVLNYSLGIVDIHNFNRELSEKEINKFISDNYRLDDIYYMCGNNLTISETWDTK